MVEGEAVRVTDEPLLRRLADAYVAKYGQTFVFDVREGAMYADDSPEPAFAFEVRPTKAFAFAKGDPFSQTRYRFARAHEGAQATLF